MGVATLSVISYIGEILRLEHKITLESMISNHGDGVPGNPLIWSQLATFPDTPKSDSYQLTSHHLQWYEQSCQPRYIIT